MKNCVWTAPARADRGSDPPEKLTKTLKKRSTNRHTYKPDFPPKSTSKETPQTDENLSWQKTESTIVLAMLHSTGKSQVVFSHKKRNGKCLLSGLRAAPAARPRPRNGAKRPPRILYVFNKSASKMRKSGTKNETKSTK